MERDFRDKGVDETIKPCGEGCQPPYADADNSFDTSEMFAI